MNPATDNDDRPTWARRANLPTYEQLRYFQTLLVAVSIGLLGMYLVGRTLGNPARLLTAARERTGV